MNVTHLDVAAELGRDITDSTEVAQVNRWIKAAKVLIRSRLGDLDALDQEALEVVIPQAVARKARNPEGKQNERIDDYSYGLSKAAGSGEVTLTDEEWALITPARSVEDISSWNISLGTGAPGPALDSERGCW